MNALSFPLQPGGIIITGAGSGIGLETVKIAAGCGLTVFAVDRDEAKLRSLAQSMPHVIPHTFDLRETERISELVAAFQTTSIPIRYLVNNAGLWEGKKIHEMEDDVWRKHFQVNLDAPFALLRGIAPLIRLAGGGAVVSVTSRNALRSSVGLAAYDASKAALNALTRTAAGELAAWNIRINSVMPGVIATPGEKNTKDEVFSGAYHKLIPMDRYGRAEEIASVILFLLSGGASFINGEAILVDGGQMACQDNGRFRQIFE